MAIKLWSMLISIIIYFEIEIPKLLLSEKEMHLTEKLGWTAKFWEWQIRHAIDWNVIE